MTYSVCYIDKIGETIESYAGEINSSQKKNKRQFPIEIKRSTYPASQRYSLPTKKR